jgi:hypothetical protein
MAISMRRRRSRIVSFRLSQEEYDSLKSISCTRGANSVSEYTRLAAFHSDPNGIETTLDRIKDQLKNLDVKLQQVIEAKNHF